jgi:hypothetical protein
MDWAFSHAFTSCASAYRPARHANTLNLFDGFEYFRPGLVREIDLQLYIEIAVRPSRVRLLVRGDESPFAHCWKSGKKRVKRRNGPTTDPLEARMTSGASATNSAA